MSALVPLLGVEQTWQGHVYSVSNDPERRFAATPQYVRCWGQSGSARHVRDTTQLTPEIRGGARRGEDHREHDADSSTRHLPQAQ